MGNQNVANNIIDAVSTIIDRKLSGLVYDQTVTATIVKVIDASQGSYEVSYQSLIYKAYTDDPSIVYKRGEQVYLLFPSSAPSGAQKQILGKVKMTNEVPIAGEGTLLNGKYKIESPNFYSKEDNILIDFTTDSAVEIDINKDMMASYLQYCEGFILGASLKTNIKNYNFNSTFNYGFRIQIETAAGEKTLLFEAREMNGTFYAFNSFTLQEKYFSTLIDGLPSISNIKKVEFFVNDVDMELSEGEPHRIEIKDLYFYGVKDIVPNWPIIGFSLDEDFLTLDAQLYDSNYTTQIFSQERPLEDIAPDPNDYKPDSSNYKGSEPASEENQYGYKFYKEAAEEYYSKLKKKAEAGIDYWDFVWLYKDKTDIVLPSNIDNLGQTNIPIDQLVNKHNIFSLTSTHIVKKIKASRGAGVLQEWYKGTKPDPNVPGANIDINVSYYVYPYYLNEEDENITTYTDTIYYYNADNLDGKVKVIVYDDSVAGQVLKVQQLSSGQWKDLDDELYDVSWLDKGIESPMFKYVNSYPISYMMEDHCYAIVRKLNAEFPYYLYWNKLSLSSFYGDIINEQYEYICSDSNIEITRLENGDFKYPITNVLTLKEGVYNWQRSIVTYSSGQVITGAWELSNNTYISVTYYSKQKDVMPYENFLLWSEKEITPSANEEIIYQCVGTKVNNAYPLDPASVFSDIKIWSWGVEKINPNNEKYIETVKATEYFYLNTQTIDQPFASNDNWSTEKKYIAGMYLWTKVIGNDGSNKIYLIEYTALSDKASYLMVLTDEVYSYAGSLTATVVGMNLKNAGILTTLEIYSGAEKVSLNDWTFDITPKLNGENALSIDKNTGAITWADSSKSPFVESAGVGQTKRYEIKAILNDIVLYKTFTFTSTRQTNFIVINESSIDITDFSVETIGVLEFEIRNNNNVLQFIEFESNESSENLLIVEYINTPDDTANPVISYDDVDKKYTVQYFTDINLGGVRIRLLDPQYGTQNSKNNIDVKTIPFITSGTSPYQIQLSGQSFNFSPTLDSSDTREIQTKVQQGEDEIPYYIEDANQQIYYTITTESEYCSIQNDIITITNPFVKGNIQNKTYEVLLNFEVIKNGASVYSADYQIWCQRQEEPQIITITGQDKFLYDQNDDTYSPNQITLRGSGSNVEISLWKVVGIKGDEETELTAADHYTVSEDKTELTLNVIKVTQYDSIRVTAQNDRATIQDVFTVNKIIQAKNGTNTQVWLNTSLITFAADAHGAILTDTENYVDLYAYIDGVETIIDASKVSVNGEIENELEVTYANNKFTITAFEGKTLGSELSCEGILDITIEYKEGSEIKLPLRWMKNNADKPVTSTYEVSGVVSAYCATSSSTLVPPLPQLFDTNSFIATQEDAFGDINIYHRWIDGAAEDKQTDEHNNQYTWIPEDLYEKNENTPFVWKVETNFVCSFTTSDGIIVPEKTMISYPTNEWNEGVIFTGPGAEIINTFNALTNKGKMQGVYYYGPTFDENGNESEEKSKLTAETLAGYTDEQREKVELYINASMIKSGILEVSNNTGTLFYANKDSSKVYIGGFEVSSAGLLPLEEDATEEERNLAKIKRGYISRGQGSYLGDTLIITGLKVENGKATIANLNVQDNIASVGEVKKEGIYLGTDGIGLGQGNFWVDKEGNGNFKGIIKAKDGDIGGWQIADTGLYKDNAGYRVKLTAAKDNDLSSKAFSVVQLENETEKENNGLPFSVDYKGHLIASTGNIGDWQLNPLLRGMGDVGNDGNLKDVQTTGLLVRQYDYKYLDEESQNIIEPRFTGINCGHINVLSNDVSLVSPKIKDENGNAVDNWQQVQFFAGAYQAPEAKTNDGQSIPAGRLCLKGNTPFYVLADGSTFISAAKIGNWYIKTVNFNKNGTEILSNPSTVYTMYASTSRIGDSYYGSGIAVSDRLDDPIIWGGMRTGVKHYHPWSVGMSAGDDWTLERALKERTPFYVTAKGDMYAKSGEIAGWTINADSLSAPKIENTETIWIEEENRTLQFYTYGVPETVYTFTLNPDEKLDNLSYEFSKTDWNWAISNGIDGYLKPEVLQVINNATKNTDVDLLIAENIYPPNNYAITLRFNVQVTKFGSQYSKTINLQPYISKNKYDSAETITFQIYHFQKTAVFQTILTPNKDNSNNFYQTDIKNAYIQNLTVGSDFRPSNIYKHFLFQKIFDSAQYDSGFKGVDNERRDRYRLCITVPKDIKQAYLQIGNMSKSEHVGTKYQYLHVDFRDDVRVNGTLYTASGTVSKSDENAKNSILIQPEKYSTLFYRLNPVIFKYNDGQSNRFHTGLIAQDVEQAMFECGIDSKDFAALCYDIDENGNKTNYGIRYEELVSMCIKEIQNNHQEIEFLKNELSLLKASINN